MDFLTSSLKTAFALIVSWDPEVFNAVYTSIIVAVWSTVLAALFGAPLGIAIGASKFRGRRLVITLLNTLMALPTVVVGLVVYGFLSRMGPLGEMNLLFTPKAIIIGQTILAVPIVAHYSVGTLAAADPRIIPTAVTLGAGPIDCFLQLLLEVRFGMMAAVIAGFGRVIAEVGVAMMLGGNIRGYTRTMTTAIAMETGKGEFAFGLALGIILMAVALVVNMLLNLVQQK
jgi:tungstate transport system permease protein